jgi:hypothetical protein
MRRPAHAPAADAAAPLPQAHRSYAAHACAVAPETRELLVIVCPLCAASVQLRPGEAPDAAFDRHSRAGCDPRDYARATAKPPRCPARGCKERLTAINTYACKARLGWWGVERGRGQTLPVGAA